MVCHRSISQFLKRDLVAHDRSGIRPSKNIRLTEVQRGGPQNLSCTPKDCRRLQNMVWVHSHFKDAYEHFHDAICFDTTHLVNLYNMTCALLASNNQMQSILLGCALLSHEDIVSYKLIFRTWIELLNSKIAHGEFKSMILDSISIENFEIRWAEYISNKGLLQQAFILRRRNELLRTLIYSFGLVCYLHKEVRECMYFFFEGFISRQGTLKLFVHQYELAIRAKHEKELEAEYRSWGFHIISHLLFKWEE